MLGVTLSVVVKNSVEIEASPEAVFEYCTDMEREAEWNPRTRFVEKVTRGPIGRARRC